MTGVATYRSLLPTVLVLCVVLPAAWLLLASPHSLLSAWTDLDFHYLAFPITLGCGLLLLNRLLLLARLTTPGREVAARLSASMHEGPVSRRLLASAPFALSRLPLDVGWMVLALSLLSSVAQLPDQLSSLPDGPDLYPLAHYLDPFSSMADLSAFLLLLPFVLVRAAAEARPVLLEIVRFPLVRLIVFGLAYLLLTDRGILYAAFEVQGSTVLMWFGLALALSYGASTLRRFLSAIRPDKGLRECRAALIVLEVAWVAALLSSVAALPSAAEPALAGLEPLEADAYLTMLGSLSGVAAALFLPFILLRAIGILAPVVDRVVGFPAAHILLFMAVYVVFSKSGVLATAVEFNPSQAMAVLTQVLAISYAASVLRNVAVVGIPGRYGALAARTIGPASTVVRSAAWALAVLVVLNHLPVVNAALLEHSSTRQTGIEILPLFGSLFDGRYAIAALCFVTAIAASLPQWQADGILGRYSSMLSAFVFGAAAFLAWAIGASMSALGHGFVLGGALAGSGMYLLALSHLAAYAESSSNRMIADLAGWLAASKLRAFVIGMNAAFYVLLLRPVLYEYLWLAPLYEYTALLLLMLVVLMRILNHMRMVESATGPAAPEWTGWSHHRQRLESRPDQRTEITASLRQAFVFHGEWKTLWTYQMGLLYDNNASIDSMREACRPLRNSTAAPSILSVLGGRKRTRADRAAAVEESLESMRHALDSSAMPLGRISENDLRGAARTYIESGTDHDALALTLISACIQRGDDLAQAVDQWFHILDIPDAPPRRFWPPRWRSVAATADRDQRVRLVEDAVSRLFVDTTQRDRVTLGSPA